MKDTAELFASVDALKARLDAHRPLWNASPFCRAFGVMRAFLLLAEKVHVADGALNFLGYF